MSRPPRSALSTLRDGASAGAPGPVPPAGEGAARSATSAGAVDTALAPAERYRLGSELARGGMGRIYVGEDKRLGREVAIKVLVSADPALIERFEREAKLAARLQHPGIVRVHDVGAWPTGEPFLVMDLVRGRPFDRVIAEAETVSDRLALLPHLIAMADAMAYAHDRGVIHRDLKPSNILIGAFGEAVIIDWGLAHVLGSDERPGVVLGTPAYMPPEQARGEAADATADVYALGALIYHALSGTPPHAGSGTSEVIAQAASQQPVSLARLEPGLPRDLVAIVDKAMAPERSARYPSAFELSEDLRRIQTGQLVSARRYSPFEIARRSVTRPPVLWTAAALAAAAVAIHRCS